MQVSFAARYGPGIGIVTLQSNPIGPGSTDTIIQRQAAATINGAAIPIQITALSLESTAPVDVGGSFFDVFVTLDTANLSKDTGTMSVMGSLAGGTYDSSFIVYLDSHFVPVSTGAAFDFLNNLSLTSIGAPWSPIPRLVLF